MFPVIVTLVFSVCSCPVELLTAGFLSPASANICNVGLMRHNELSEGVDVLDNNGKVVGSSKIAARHVSCLFVARLH